MSVVTGKNPDNSGAACRRIRGFGLPSAQPTDAADERTLYRIASIRRRPYHCRTTTPTSLQRLPPRPPLHSISPRPPPDLQSCGAKSESYEGLKATRFCLKKVKLLRFLAKLDKKSPTGRLKDYQLLSKKKNRISKSTSPCIINPFKNSYHKYFWDLCAIISNLCWDIFARLKYITKMWHCLFWKSHVSHAGERASHCLTIQPVYILCGRHYK